jgi:hypothetical protein
MQWQQSHNNKLLNLTIRIWMEKIMRVLIFLMACVFTVSAMAHEDHALGASLGHSLFHAIFLIIALAVVLKGIAYFRRKRHSTKS